MSIVTGPISHSVGQQLLQGDTTQNTYFVSAVAQQEPSVGIDHKGEPRNKDRAAMLLKLRDACGKVVAMKGLVGQGD